MAAMLRSTVVRASRTLIAQRAFSTSRVAMAGEVGSGASRSGGERAGDSFTKREKAQEDLWIKEEEKKKLLELKAKLDAQSAHIEELRKNIDEIVKNQGGEQH